MRAETLLPIAMRSSKKGNKLYSIDKLEYHLAYIALQSEYPTIERL